MNNISGALGVVQMEKLDAFLRRRKEVYETYLKELSDCEWLIMPGECLIDCIPSYYFFWIQLEKRDELARYLLDNGVYSSFRYWPLNRIKYFDHESSDLPNTDYVCEHTLNIPLHQSLTDEDIEKVVGLIKSYGKKYI